MVHLCSPSRISGTRNLRELVLQQFPGFHGYSAAFGTFLMPQHDTRCIRECREVLPAALTCEPGSGTALLLWGFIPRSIQSPAGKSICWRSLTVIFHSNRVEGILYNLLQCLFGYFKTIRKFPGKLPFPQVCRTCCQWGPHPVHSAWTPGKCCLFWFLWKFQVKPFLCYVRKVRFPYKSFSHETPCSGSFTYNYHYRGRPTRLCAILLSQRTPKAPEIILDIYRYCHLWIPGQPLVFAGLQEGITTD